MAVAAVLRDAVWFFLVALVWGCTNPLLKKGSQGIEEVHGRNRLTQVLAELQFLALNWRYAVPFLVNQSGSLLYYLTLAEADISLAVPITNSLTFIVTTLAGRWLGEEPPPAKTYCGMALVLCGVSLCVIGKFH